MKISVKIIVLALLIVGAYSCMFQRPIVTNVSSNNDTYQVSYLFEHEGCKVYRFYDRQHYVYFTNCNGETTSIERDSTENRIINVTKTK